jgi:crotonobetaine/carnitine-CoA ligase
MTEISCPIVGGWNDEVVTDASRCGTLREGFDVRIVDADDVEVPRGQPGELVIRSDDPWTLMQGYLGREADTVAAWRNLWFHTGDLFVRHEDGTFAFVGRRKDMIRRRGENVSAQEVETFALARDELLEAAAVGVEVDDGDEEILLAYVVKQGREISVEDLRRFLEERLPRFMVPRFFREMAAFPKTATGKIQKEVLRQEGRCDGVVDTAPGPTGAAHGGAA